jgi:hypothetical protein
MGIVFLANQGLAFILEIISLWALGSWGFRLQSPRFMGFVLGIGVPVIFAIGWGIWAAPKSPRRLKGKNLFIFKTAAYTMATFALLESDQVRTSILFGFLGAVNLYLNFISRNQGY